MVAATSTGVSVRNLATATEPLAEAKILEPVLFELTPYTPDLNQKTAPFNHLVRQLNANKSRKKSITTQQEKLKSNPNLHRNKIIEGAVGLVVSIAAIIAGVALGLFGSAGMVANPAMVLVLAPAIWLVAVGGVGAFASLAAIGNEIYQMNRDLNAELGVIRVQEQTLKGRIKEFLDGAEGQEMLEDIRVCGESLKSTSNYGAQGRIADPSQEVSQEVNLKDYNLGVRIINAAKSNQEWAKAFEGSGVTASVVDDDEEEQGLQ